MEKETDEAIAKVLNADHMGGAPSWYQVHHTAERVMLVFGVFPGQHRDVMRDLIFRQTDGGWKEDEQLASLIGAKLAIGLPSAIISLKERLTEAGVKGLV